MSTPVAIEPLDRPPDAVVTLPGSKSHTNRALICAALAPGTSRLRGALFADDTEAMLRSLSAIGIAAEADRGEATITIEGGLDRFLPGPRVLDAGQSGTTSRFVLAIAALGPGPYVVDGHDQLRARPFGPLLTALTALGADIEGDRLPLRVAGGGLRTGRVELSGSVSSQFLSGLLLAAPLARPVEGPQRRDAVEIDLADELVSKPYVDLTIATMSDFGVEVRAEDHRRFTVAPQTYRPATVAIEPDASAASYFFAAAAVTGGRVRVEGLGRNALQGDMAFVDVLEQMGAAVERGDEYTEVSATSGLAGIDVDMADMSDVAQTLAIVATFASSPTRITGIDFIKNKEIDRVSAMIDELTALGIVVERSPGGITVHPGTPRPGRVTTSDDHRMAMSFALLGLVNEGIELDDASCVNKTFPTYFSVLDQLR